MRVLITGGAGFIGCHLAATLAKAGVIVHLVDFYKPEADDSDFLQLLSLPTIRFTQTDLCNRRSLEDFETDYTHIIHLAALVGVENVIQRANEVLSVNVELTLNLLQLAKRQKQLSQFLFASTSEVYAATLEYGSLSVPTPEDSALILPSLAEPRTSYMLSKIYGEALCVQSGLPFTIIRPHNIYGPRMGMKHVIPQLLKKAYFSEDGKIDVFSVEHTRTFCFISDAVEMITRLMSNKSALGLTINIGTETPEITIGQLAELVIKTVGRDLTIRPKQATQGSPRRRAPQMQKCHLLTDYSSKIDVEYGLKLCFDWYMRNVFHKST